MAGRLVQNEDVRPLKDEDGQRDPSLLPAGEVIDALEDVVPREAIGSKEIPGFTDPQPARLDDGIQHRTVGD